MKKVSVKIALIVSMTFLVVLAVTLVSGYSIYKINDSLMIKAYDQLASVRAIKKNQVVQYFKERSGDICGH